MTQLTIGIKPTFAPKQSSVLKFNTLLVEEGVNETLNYCPITVEFGSRHNWLLSAFAHHPGTITPRE
jgi:hypothetical protein